MSSFMAAGTVDRYLPGPYDDCHLGRVGRLTVCYVSAPFGRKTDANGREIDFDDLYHDVLEPAIAAEGIDVTRADDATTGGTVHRGLLRAVVASDVFVADLTTANANVMYELGVRHALRRGVTLIITADSIRIPYNLSLMQVLSYELDDGGRMREPERFRKQLARRVRDGLTRVSNDSPMYDFFPGLVVDLPDELRPAPTGAGTVRRVDQGGAEDRATGQINLPLGSGRLGSSARASDLRKMEQQLRSTADIDPFSYIALLRRYRDESAWDDVIRLGTTLPSDVQDDPEAIQIVALALNRRNDPGDHNRAIEVIERLISETGGDAESFGVLGRIHKDRWTTHQAQGNDAAAMHDLNRAIEAYRAGFDDQPSEPYLGVNLVQLLRWRGMASDADELLREAPRVRAALDARATEGREDFWSLATRLELEVAVHDWDRALTLAQRCVSQGSSSWEREAVRSSLEMMVPVTTGRDREYLLAIIDLFNAPVMGTGRG